MSVSFRVSTQESEVFLVTLLAACPPDRAGFDPAAVGRGLVVSPRQISVATRVRANLIEVVRRDWTQGGLPRLVDRKLSPS